MKLCFPDIKYKSHGSDYYLSLKNGSEIWIGGLDDSDRVEKILGKEYSTLYFNECSQLDYKSITTALTRLAEKNGLKKKAYFDMNPPTKSHWSYDLFYRGIDPIDNVPIDKKDFVSIVMNPEDNLENIAPEYLKFLMTLPQQQRDRFLKGLFADSDDGSAYYAFKRDVHVADTQKSHGSIFIGMDFNVLPMTAIISQIFGDEIHVHDEVYFEQPADTFKMANKLIELGYAGHTIIPDSTGANRKTSGQSDHLILKEAGFVINSTHNPFVRDRVNNTNRLFTSNKIKINPKCKKLIADLEKVAWKNDDLDEGKDKMLTHITDCLGYVAWKFFPLRKDKQTTTIQL